MKHMNPTQLFTQVKKFQTVAQLKEWAREIGFDFNQSEASDHNYQNFFHLIVLMSELDRVKDDSVLIINHDNIEIVVDDLNHSMYGKRFPFTNIHKLE